jgi:hypothetical protein
MTARWRLAAVSLLCLGLSGVSASETTRALVSDPPAAVRAEPERPSSPQGRIQVPVIRLGPQPPVTQQEATRIKALIAELARIDSPDFGLSPTIYGMAFAPVPDSGQALTLLLTDHHLQTTSTLRQLVELGPRALPFLLDALEDRTPTRLTIKHPGGFGGMHFEDRIWGDPTNPAERDFLAAHPSLRELYKPFTTDPLTEYTVKVGDVCLVAIGQIVNRSYSAVRYQPTAHIMLNSPIHDPALARQVRAIWSSKNPAEHLLNSLLHDYTTPDSLFQPGAVMRLLYYFPREATPMIVDRLRQLDALERQDVTNGVRATEFVKAVAWCEEPAVRAELLSIFRRTTHPNVMGASLPAIGREHLDLVLRKVGAFIDQLPAAEGGPYTDGHNLLLALGGWAGPAARPIFCRYMRVNAVQRRVSVCEALRFIDSDWGVEILTPLLDDRRPANFGSYSVKPGTNSPELPIRVCDLAAATLHELRPELPFEMRGTHKDLDEQIRVLRTRLPLSAPQQPRRSSVTSEGATESPEAN